MTDVPGASPVFDQSQAARLFPALTDAQIARIASYGSRRRIRAGEVLIEPGTEVFPFFVVVSGAIEIVRPSSIGGASISVHVHSPGEFTGDTNMLLGRPALMRSTAIATGEALAFTHEQLLALVQTDSEISDILMRTFIYRRLAIIDLGIGDVVVIGSMHSAATLRIREFLARNGHPLKYFDLDRDPDVQTLLDRFHVAPVDIPFVICRGDMTLRNPSNQELAKCLGFNRAIDGRVRDVVIVGAGPSGLAAAVYGASEGLDVLVIESNSPGGQAASSSKIENYLGFPSGVSGQELAGRALTQAQKFGAQITIANGARGLTCDRRPYEVQLEDGTHVVTRTVVIATGAEYRRPAIENLARFEGMGVYYGATHIEAQVCAGEEVLVVGGGNSAGQAAVYLSQTAKRVSMIVRSGGLADTMSRYLIRRIEDSPSIEVRPFTEIVALEGDGHLERVHSRDNASGKTVGRDIRHLFLMTGAVPNTAWLHGCAALDAKGFIKTGSDLTPDELTASRWPLTRAPHLLETSLPGVFAVGDVRGGNVKRVASAVGEGSIAISFVHRVLAE